MANKITRTISHTVVTLKCVNKDTETIERQVVHLADEVSDPKAQMRLAKKQLPDNLEPFTIEDSFTESALYEMPLETFIANATKVTE